MRKKIIINNKETNYSVTDDGKIFNDKTNKELKGTYSTNEYHSVQLTIEGKPKTFMFHRLIAEAFCENPNNYTIVDHIDRDKHNDKASNLRWVDASTNAKNCVKSKKRKREKYIGDFLEKLWKPVYGIKSDDYFVSEDGEFVKKSTMEYLLFQERNSYYRICIDGTLYSAHIKVWESFNNKKVPEKHQIDHIDGNKQNNKISNLRLTTSSENMKNAYRNGHKNQVSVLQYSLDGKFIKKYNTIREAALENSVLEEGLRGAIQRYGTCGGFYWLKEDSEKTISQVIYDWIPEGYKILKDFPNYCMNEQGQVYNKRNKKHTPIHYRADGVTPYVVLNSNQRINIDALQTL